MLVSPLREAELISQNQGSEDTVRTPMKSETREDTECKSRRDAGCLSYISCFVVCLLPTRKHARIGHGSQEISFVTLRIIALISET